MNHKTKHPMTVKKNVAIFAPLSALTMALAISFPILSNVFAPTLNTVFGEGKLTTEKTEDINSDYYETLEAADATSNSVKSTYDVAKEGAVLLKNSDCLPLTTSEKIAPFGYGYYRTGTTGGSSNWNGSQLSTKSLSEGIKDKFAINETIDKLTSNANVIESKAAEGTEPENAAGICDFKRSLLSLEFDCYKGKEADCNGSVGVMAVTRNGNEGVDFKMDAYADGSAHALQLTKNEMDTLKFMKANCKKAILVITSGNILEINDDTYNLCDAIIYLPTPGSGGAQVVGEILDGEVNPSGRTVDTWSKDFLKNPTTANFGFNGGKYSTLGTSAMIYNNVKQLDSNDNAAFVEYEEGIYMGYRYYETAAKENAIVYEDEVQFPFGYGLSYTTFSQAFKKEEAKDGKLYLTVEVTNTGDVKGQEAVQIYYAAPYTDYDKTNHIEKASKNLIAFDKTEELEPGKSQELTLSFTIDDMASYFTVRENADGSKGCYYLEQGQYDIYLGKNSHEAYDTYEYANEADIYYDNNNPRLSEKEGQAELDKDGNPTSKPKSGDTFVAATNLFQSSSDYMNQSTVTNLTRQDFKNTMPSTPTDQSRTLADTYKEEFESYKSSNVDIKDHPILGNEKGSKARDTTPFKVEQKDIVLSALRGKDYNDPLWDDLINEISFKSEDNKNQIGKLLGYGAYNTAKLDAIGKISTIDFDGPLGFSTFGLKKDYKWCNYTSQILLGCTFNPRLMYERGKAMGQEGLANGVQGLYAPGMNLHRSPFGGRNGEYTSEDPFMTGMVGANIMSGAADGGIYMYMKHFAMNEQESNRMDMLMSWANEQTIRELYLKPFEIATKKARQKLNYWNSDTHSLDYKVIRGCTGVMTAFTCIGPVMSSQNWYLLNGALRGEWGFDGMVITDYGPQVELDQMLRAGNDFYLTAFNGVKGMSITDMFKDSSSITALHSIRKAIKNICYTEVNSGTYNKIAPNAKSYRERATWDTVINYVMVTILYTASGLFVALIIASIIRNHLWEKKHSETTNSQN